MPRHTRRNLLLGLGAGLGAALAGCTSPAPPNDGEGRKSPPKSMNRLAVTAAGAEVTGLFLDSGQTLFMNVQHPSDVNQKPYDRAAIGVFLKSLENLPRDFTGVTPPSGTQKTVTTAYSGYQVLAHGGDTTDGGDKLGATYSMNGQQLTTPTHPDGNVYIPDTPTSGYLYTNWESKPGAVSRICLSRPTSSDEWRVDCMENLDLHTIEGTWRNCFATRSPWGTPLIAEELYFDNTSQWNSPARSIGVRKLERYLGHFPNPYRYGHIVEIQNPADDLPKPTKQFTFGRFSHENAVVMPDEKTVYLTDDGTGTAFFKFVADKAGDLSAGTLYAAKITQKRRVDGTIGFDIEWLELAHATRSEVESWIAEYDDVTPADYVPGQTSYISEAEIQAWAEGNASDDRVAFLESRKAAEAIGATAEFQKMEVANVRRGVRPGDYMYLAMSKLTEEMADGTGDIQVPPNPYGAVYRMKLDSNFDVSFMEPVITGGPDGSVKAGDETSASPTAYPNSLANPDNLVVMQDGRVVVGEDTHIHDNAMLWVYDPGS